MKFSLLIQEVGQTKNFSTFHYKEMLKSSWPDLLKICKKGQHILILCFSDTFNNFHESWDIFPTIQSNSKDRVEIFFQI